MRFEIKAGGGFLILAGLVGLSGAVFALGLVAGYEMARQNQPDSSQISSTYPLPNSPDKPPPVSEMSPAAAASQSVAVASAPHVAPIRPAPPIGEKPPVTRPPPATAPRVEPPPAAPAVDRPTPENNEEETDEDSEMASAPKPRALPPGAKPYNIMIEALMDRSAADEMVSRLKALGYNAQEIKVEVNGQPGYRVRVGPYPSAEEATDAQNRLHEQYKQAYSTSH